MIIVDTSIWVEFFRGSRQIVSTLNDLLDDNEVVLVEPVYLEILNGIKAKEVKLISRVMSALPHCYPERNHWLLIRKWITNSKKSGYNFSIPDLLIAAMAHLEEGKIWSLDSDFKRLEKLGHANLF